MKYSNFFLKREIVTWNNKANGNFLKKSYRAKLVRCAFERVKRAGQVRLIGKSAVTGFGENRFFVADIIHSFVVAQVATTRAEP